MAGFAYNEIVDAIIVNNPEAVSSNLEQLGLSQGALSPDQIKAVLFNTSQQLGGQEIVNQALTVPINPNGAGANYLTLAFQQLNTNPLVNQFTSNPKEKTPCSCSKGQESNNTGTGIIGFLMVVLLVLCIIKISKNLMS